MTTVYELHNHNFMKAAIFTSLVLLIRFGDMVKGQTIESLFEKAGEFPLVFHWEKTPFRAARGTLEVSHKVTYG